MKNQQLTFITTLNLPPSKRNIWYGHKYRRCSSKNVTAASLMMIAITAEQNNATYRTVQQSQRTQAQAETYTPTTGKKEV